MNKLIVAFNRMKNEVHAEFHTSIEASLARANPVTLGIVLFYEAYKKALSVEMIALLAIRKSTVTPDITAADELRDMLYRGFVHAVQSAACHFDEAHRAAAAIIEALLDHYGNIAVRTLDAETVALNDLLNNLATGSYPAAIETLGLSEWTVKLREANDRFTDLMTARYTEKAQRPTVNMRAARPATDKAYRALVFALDTMAAQSPSEAMTALVGEMTAIADRYRTIGNKGAAGSKKAESDPPAEGTEPTEPTA